MSSNIRKAISAGNLYPSEPASLKKAIENSFLHAEGPGKLPDQKSAGHVLGLVVPHDMITNSGPVAAHAYSRVFGLDDFDTVVLLGPDQKNTASEVTIYPNGVWETPLGQIEVDEEVCKKIANDFPKAKLDTNPHMSETSLEVQLPFLQYVFKHTFKIVPICVPQLDVSVYVELGKVIAKVAKERKILVIGVSNLVKNSVYAQALQRDAIVFDRIAKPVYADMAKLYNTMQEKKIAISGYGPVTAVVTVVQQLGTKKTEAVKYTTSGQTTGDYSSVVGYCAMAFV